MVICCGAGPGPAATSNLVSAKTSSCSKSPMRLRVAGLTFLLRAYFCSSSNTSRRCTGSASCLPSIRLMIGAFGFTPNAISPSACCAGSSSGNSSCFSKIPSSLRISRSWISPITSDRASSSAAASARRACTCSSVSSSSGRASAVTGAWGSAAVSSRCPIAASSPSVKSVGREPRGRMASSARAAIKPPTPAPIPRDSPVPTNVPDSGS